MRNDIIHRGILKDPDLGPIRDRLARLELLSLFDPSDADAEAEAIRVDLQNYLLQKQSEFTQHLQATIALLDEMIAYLQPSVENKITLARGDKKSNLK